METQTLPTDQPQLMNHAVDAAVKLLRAGDVVALPTETVYGLGADALNADAVAKVFAAKERPSFDPLIVHLPQKTDLALVAEVPPELQKVVTQLTERFWPGPLTLILPKKACVPDIVTSGLPSVAVRVSSNPVFSRVAKALGRPIAAPSANRFGSISPTSAGAVLAELGGRIPLILDGGASLHGLESTIIKIEPADPKPLITILRPGPVIPDDLKQYGRLQRVSKKLVDQTAEAPGQLASHYAPRTPLRLLERPSDFKPEPGRRYALLSYRGDADDGYLYLTDWKQTAVLSPGKGKLPEAAVRFFYALRELDRCGADEIIAEPMHEFGLGIAMMDRLRRAASDKVGQASSLPSEAPQNPTRMVAPPSGGSRVEQASSLPPETFNPATRMDAPLLDRGPSQFIDLYADVSYFDPRGEIENEERHLPHWRQPGRTYFVTFRLGDALPRVKLDELRQERNQWLESHPEPWSDAESREYHRLFSERVQDWLDAGSGSCVLGDERAAALVEGALRHFDGDRYELLAWAVMPNHVHALITPRGGFTLDKILHSWKSFTGNEINQLLNREGPLWQHEGHDHIVRSPEALWSIAKYITDNPRKAGIASKHAGSRIRPT